METQPDARLNWLAPTSLALGTLGFMTFFLYEYMPALLFGPVSIILGSISLQKKCGHRNQAIGGIILGGLTTFLVLLLIALMFILLRPGIP